MSPQHEDPSHHFRSLCNSTWTLTAHFANTELIKDEDGRERFEMRLRVSEIESVYCLGSRDSLCGSCMRVG